MKAIFYDRRNHREVSNEQLVPAHLVYGVMTVDVDDPDYGFTVDAGRLPMEVGGRNIVIGEFGYKSETCESYKNWDLYCMYTDLVFLRFEE